MGKTSGYFMNYKELTENPLFHGMDQVKLERLCTNAEIIDLPVNYSIQTGGKQLSDAYVILSGKVVGVTVSETGRELGVVTLETGNVFGNICIVSGQPTPLSFLSVCPGRALRIPSAPFRAWINADKTLSLNLARTMAALLRRQNQRVFEWGAFKVGKRVRLELARAFTMHGAFSEGGTLSPAPNHAVIASMLGANREAVSREIGDLGRRGILRSSRQQIVLLNPAGLVAEG